MPAKRSEPKKMSAKKRQPSSPPRPNAVSERLSRTLQRMSEYEFRSALADASTMLLIDLAHRQKLAFPKERRNALKNSPTPTAPPR